MKLFINPFGNAKLPAGYYMFLWVMFVLLTTFPGMLLFICSLGTFNYFGICAGVLDKLHHKAYT